MSNPAHDVMAAHGRRQLRLGPLHCLVRPRVAVACGLALLGLLLGALWVLPQGLYETQLSSLWRSTDPMQRMVWLDFRLPRVLTALLAGGMLGVAGAAMQTLARNGLADPGLVGIKEGAAVAVVGMAVFFPDVGAAWRSAAGLLGGLCVASVVVALSRDLSKVRFILVGIGVSWLLHGVIACFMTLADIKDVQTALVWMAGSLHAAAWETFWPALCWAVVGTVLLVVGARGAGTLVLGAPAAAGLGVALKRASALYFVGACVLTAAAVAAVGSLGFVGLIAPHLARLTLRGRQAALLTGSVLYGAGLVLLADSLGRLVFAPLQIPAGVVMAVVGVPFLLALLWRRRDQL